jgi:hypothetical protein
MNEVKAMPWAVAVAAELGDGWKAEQRHYEDSAYLVGPDGERVHVHAGGYLMDGRVELSWSIPQELTEHSRHNEVTRKKITVSDQKPPFMVAKDLKRRLLPGLARLVAQLDDRRTTSDKANAERAAFLEEITKVLAGEVLQYAADRCRFGDYNELPVGEVRVLSGEVEMELRVTRTQALTIALVLAAMRGGE